ncbi:MAG TPA: IS982 family transposase [Candidatus Saccharimonadales bacterium]|nr:IS982 family transposase [Candidatus Saccharimonadales bacterium]
MLDQNSVALDKATVLTTIFTIVDDVMKGSAVIQRALRRPGRAPHLSDSEVVTIALYQELIGEPREDHFFRLHRWSLLPFFPKLNERSRYNRRKRDMWSVILAVRLSLQVVLDALEREAVGAVDSAPVPCVGRKRDKSHSDFVGVADYGVCSSKAMKYFGCKLHAVVSLAGVVLGYMLTSAAPYDNQPLTELLDSMPHRPKYLLGDGAYNDEKLQDYLKQYSSLILLAPTRVNQQPKRTKEQQKTQNRLRLICETVNAQLQEQLHLSKHYAKSIWGFMTRVATKLTAHSIGMMVNRMWGRPALRLAELAV